MIDLWTIGRASGIGATAALVALLLWPFQRGYGALLWPFAGLAAIAGLCGLSILFITAVDMILRRRGKSIRPVRGFDIVLGALLVALSLMQLQEVQAQLPA